MVLSSAKDEQSIILVYMLINYYVIISTNGGALGAVGKISDFRPQGPGFNHHAEWNLCLTFVSAKADSAVSILPRLVKRVPASRGN